MCSPAVFLQDRLLSPHAELFSSLLGDKAGTYTEYRLPVPPAQRTAFPEEGRPSTGCDSWMGIVDWSDALAIGLPP